MTLKLHNTLTGKIDEFVSQQDGEVKLYTCGPTVYDYPHVGNWASFIYWDILVRALAANNYDVERVMNITDVGHLVSDGDEGEDKLEKGARREGKTAWEIAEFYTNDFLGGMKQLGLIEPQHITKATDFITEQLEIVKALKEKGYTYQISDGIYFDTSKFPTYADFAHLDLDELRAGARVEFNPEKRNPSDFALWKFTPTGEKRDMEWDTPSSLLSERGVASDGAAPAFDIDRVNSKEGANQATGPTSEKNTVKGFPGWHLECSAMALSILGNTLDIHTGGIDHIPVHHTNEIAQSESVTGVRFSNYWLHNNHLKVDGTKISKSLGNGYTLDDLAQRGFSPLDYRMFILQSHYRSEGNFTFENLTAAKNRLQNWKAAAVLRHQTHDTLRDDNEKSTDERALSLYATSQAIVEALNDDLATPQALKIIDEAFSRLMTARTDDIHRRALINLLDTIDAVLGLQLIETTPDISDEAKQLILERHQAREAKSWGRSDELRDQLLSMGIEVRDTSSGSVWQYK
ncbi:MAG TPA: cysteine--tRNA ligase [Candidatus Saccharimonadales bacterium]|nr:cysteine--tRNA ligase [Candidatus Saccharimonadales bacterium]